MTCARREAGPQVRAPSALAGASRPDACSGRRRARAFRLLPALALLLGALSAFPATTASAAVLVSNIGQSAVSGGAVLQQLVAQQFTTGSNGTGYTLTSIELGIHTAVQRPDRVRAEVWSVAANGSPGSRLVSLTVPARIPAGNVTFSAPPNTVLDPNKSYFMVFGRAHRIAAGSPGRTADTKSDDEDDGKAAGWSIANNSYYRSEVAASNGAWRTFADSLRIRVNGAAVSSKSYAITPTVTADEGTSAALTVTLYEAAPRAGIRFFVSYDYSNGGASTDDTGFTPAQVSVRGGQTAATFNVQIADDSLVDPGETFDVKIAPDSSVTGWTVLPTGTDTATVTIGDEDDISGAEIAFGNDSASTSAYTASVAENVSGGSLNVPVTVSLLPGKSTTFAVQVVSGGTATEDTDYSIATKSVTFGPTDTSKTKNLAVSITSDTDNEPGETIKLKIAAADATPNDLGDHYARDASGSTATLTVTNDDVPGPPTGLTPTPGDMKIDLSWTEPAGPVTGYDVHYTSAPASGMGSVGPNEPSLANDPANGWVLVTRGTENDPPTASQAITNLSDDSSYRVRVRAKNGNGAGAWLHGRGRTFTTDATLGNLGAFGSRNSILYLESLATLSPAFSRDTTAYTVTVGHDVTHVRLRSRTNHAGATLKAGKQGSTLATIPRRDRNPFGDIAVRDVAVALGDTVFELEVTAEDGTTQTYTVTVTRQSNDATLKALTASTSTSADGVFSSLNFGTFASDTLTYTATVESTVTHAKLTPTVNQDNATVKVGKGTSLTAVDSGAASAAIELAVGENALKAEVTAQDGTKKTYTVTVTRRAPPPSTLTLSTDATSDTAGEDVGTVTVTATLDTPARTGGVSVTLAAGGTSTATASDDYTLPAAFTIAEGATAATGDVTIADDDVDEDNETVVLTTTVAGLAVTGVTLTIADDDTAGVTVAGAPLTLAAGATATYTVALNSKPTADVTVTPTSGAPANATVSAAVTFEPDDWDTPKTITVTGVKAGAATIAHAVTSTDSKYPASLGIESAAVTVTEVALSGKTYSMLSALTADEGSNAALTVWLGEAAPAAGLAFDVSYDYSGSGATADDTGTTPATVTVTGGSKLATLSVPIAADAVVDAGETFTVTIAPASGVTGWTVGSGGTATATVTITDTTPTVTFPSATASVSESASGAWRILVELSRPATSLLKIPVSYADGETDSGSDFTGQDLDVWVDAGETASATAATARRARIYNDALVEEDETFTVTLTPPSGWAAHPNASVTVTINDDDRRAGPKVAFGTDAAGTAAYTATVAENVSGGSLNAPVTVSHLPGASTTFNVEVVAGGTATEDTDYAIATKSVTFAPSDASRTKNLAISITDDADVEVDETIRLRIAAADDPANDLGDHYTRHASGATATVTIDSEDAAAPGVPTGVTVAAGDTKLDLSWAAPASDGDSAITGYDVHYTSAPATGRRAVGNNEAASGSNASTAWVADSRTETDPITTSQSIEDLTNDIEYRVRVRAKNAVGSSAWVHKTGTPQEADTTGPTATFSPANGDTETDAGTNITLSFDEPIRKDASNTDFGNDDLSGILTLKTGTSSGNDIGYTASINGARTVITIDPTANLAEGGVYVAISNGYWDAHGNQGTAASATFTVDSTAPAPTFSPLDSATVTNAGRNITLSFAEAIKADAAATPTDFTNTTVKTILTLKKTDSTGDDIGFAVSINSAKTLITIDPSADLDDGDVYVAISDGYYDAAGNQGSATSATFTVDTTAPAPTFSPADGTTVTNAGRNITLSFDEAIKKDASNTDFANSDLSGILTLKTGSSAGNDIGYSATINGAKTIITINPSANLAEGDVYVAISNGYWDADGNQGAADSATFTVDTSGPTATFSPANGDTETDASTNITLSFDEAIRKDASNTELANADLSGILTLKTGSSAGNDIGYTATINSAKTIITINPSANLGDGAVYVAISNGYFDAHGNQGTAANATFTVDTAGPAAPTFSPASGDTETDASRNITLTFTEAVKRNGNGDDFTTSAHLSAILTLKTGSSAGNDIGYSATINGAKTVITIDPSADLEDGDMYVAISNGYWDAHGNQGTAANATFTVDTAGPAAPTFSPANGDTETDASTNITLTFTEAVKRNGAGDDFTTTAHLSAILTLKTGTSAGNDIGYTASINGARTVITIDPTANLAEGGVYVAISNGYWDAHGNQGTAASAIFTVDSTAPAPTFNPLNGATVSDASRNITLSFAEAIKADAAATPTDFTNTTVKTILTLKKTNSSGDDIAFAASIDSDKDEITINPAADLEDGPVYVAISDGYYDAAGNQGGAASATFTVDTTAPAPTFSPADGTTVTNAGRNITLTFTEAIKKDASNTDFGNSDLSGILTLKTGSSAGDDIGYSATINSAKTIITINPTANLAEGDVYVAISDGYYDADGIQGSAASATFTVDTLGPTATFSPANGTTETDASTNITLSFGEAIRKDNSNANFANADLSGILTLKTGSSAGNDIGYAATINGAGTLITINPTANLAEGDVYVAISNGYYDAAGNQGAAASATFTVDTTGPAAPTFSPLDSATETDASRNITLTFDEAVKRNSDGDDFTTGAHLSAILTLKTGSSAGNDITYTPTINGAKTVITIDPSADLEEGDVYVAISNGYYDAHGNQGTAASATFTVDSTAPSPTFSPLNAATVSDASTNITLSFAEAIKADNMATPTDFTNTSVKTILTLKKTDSAGDDIAFAVTIDSDKDEITINPTADLDDGDVYVAISNGYYDAAGNQGSADSATFTVDATGVAAPAFSPANGNTVTNAGTNITLSFAEAIKADDSDTDFTDTTVKTILTLKKTDSAGNDIAFSASIDSDKDEITINPTADLDDGDVYVAVSNDYYDASGNRGTAANATFTVDSTAPSAAFSPANGNTVTDAGRNITLTFTEAIRKDASNSAFANADLSGILTLKTGSSSGSDIGYAATINGAGTQITINPTADLAAGAVYVAVSNGYYDAHGNQGDAASATFTVDTTGVAAPNFSPANGVTVTDAGTNITLTFAEAIQADGSGTAFTATTIAAILTLKSTNSSGADIGFAASIDSTKKIVTINPTADLVNGAVYVAISDAWYVGSGDQGPAANATFTVDTAALTFAFENASYLVKENVGSFVLAVDASAQVTADTTITIALSDGTAFASERAAVHGSDYGGAVTRTLTMTSGSDRVEFVQEILDDAVIEPTEKFTLTIQSVSSGAVGAPNAAVVTIQDQDAAVKFDSAAYEVAEGHHAAWNVVLTASGDLSSDFQIGLSYTAQGATAAPSGEDCSDDSSYDHEAVATTVTFFANQTRAVVPITVCHNDDGAGSAEAFTLSIAIASPVNQRVTAAAPSSTRVTIREPAMPAAPTGLGVTPGAAKLDLVWTAPPGAVASYDVHYTSDDAADTPNTEETLGSNPANGWVDASHTGTTASHTISSLTNNTAYRVRVRAVNASGNGAFAFGNGTPKATTTGSTDATLSGLVLSNSLTLAPEFARTTYAYTADAAATVTGVTVTPTVNQENATVKVNGTAVTSGNASGSIDLAIGDNAIAIEVTAQAGNSRNYTVTVTRALPTLQFDAGFLTESVEEGANVALSFDRNADNDMTVSLTYAATGEHPASLDDDVGTSRPATWEYAESDFLGVRDLPTVEDTLNEEHETFTVTIGEGTGYVVGARSVMTATITDDDPPSAPGGLSLTADHGSLAASWQKPDGPVAGYQVRYKTSTAPDSAATGDGTNPATGWVTATTDGTDLSHTIEGLSNGTLYNVQVRATDGQTGDGNGYGDWSASQSARPVANAPGRVNDLDVTAGDDSLEMTWTAPPGTVTVTGYDVHYTSAPLPDSGGGGVDNRAPLSGGSDPADGWVDGNYAGGTTVSHTIAGVTPERWMRVRVRAVTTRDGETVPGRWTVATLQLGDFPTETVETADPVVTMAAGPEVTEGTAASFTLTANPAPSANLAVTVSIAQGGDVAAPGVLGRRTVTISSGSSTASFTVATVDDTADEEDGVIWASLVNGDGYTVGGADEARVTVADDDVGIPGILASRAHATEGTDSEIIFTVHLSHAAATTVTVDWATADGSGSWAGARPATAGADYTAASGTLTFAAGRTFGEIRVAILDDAIDEGSEYFLLRFSNPVGAYIESGNNETRGLIRNDDALQGMWLSRFGRTVATQVTDAVSYRLDASLEPGRHATVAGRALDLSGDDALAEAAAALAFAFAPASTPTVHDPLAGGDPLAGSESLAGNNSLARGASSGQGEPSAQGGALALGGPGAAWDQPAVGAAARSMTARDLFLGSSFHVAGGRRGDGPGLAVWGRMAQGRFDGEQADDKGTTHMDGTVTTALLGADADFGRVLAGVALGRSEGTGAFDNASVDKGNTGRIGSTLTTVSPYVRYRLNERVSAWGLAGVGAGEMNIRFDDDTLDPVSADLGLRMGALGARGALLTQDGARGMDLSLRADAFFVTTESDAAANTAATQADSSRLRLALQGGRTFTLGGGSLQSTFELGLRHDGGDAETGAGVELGGGLAYTHNASGLSIDAKARTLVAHANAGYEEWGASATVRLDPGADGLGLSFSLMPSVGATASAAERLWGAHDARALTPGLDAFQAGSSLRAEAGYGMAVFGGRFTGTPHAGVARAEGGEREIRVGWRLTPAADSGANLQFSIEAVRRESAAGEADQGVTLNATARF